MSLDETIEINLDDLYEDNEEDNELLFSIVSHLENEIIASINASNVLILQSSNNWIGITSLTISADDGFVGRVATECIFDVTIDAIYNHAEMDLNKNTISFTTTNVDESSNIENFDIINLGHENLEVSNIIAPSGFLIRKIDDSNWENTLTNITLVEGEIITIEVKFAPTNQIYYNSNISVSSNAIINSTLNVIVTGDTRNSLPNAFTPNGDGLNDLFTISLNSTENDPISMFIYNTNGKLITEIKGDSSLPISWNGKDDNNDRCKSSPYIYYLKKDDTRIMRGKVYLVK